MAEPVNTREHRHIHVPWEGIILLVLMLKVVKDSMCELVATMVSYKHIRLRFTRAVTLSKEVMFVNTLSNTRRRVEVILHSISC
jgi:hypothetical protein